MSDSHKTSPVPTRPIGRLADRGSDLRVSKLGALLLASASFGGVVAFVLSVAAGFDSLPNAAKAAFFAALCVLFGAAHGLFVLFAAARQVIERLPMLIVASGLIRMFVGLAAALVLYLILNLEGKTFWASFLLGGLLSLLVETCWGMSAVRRLFPAAPTSSSRDSGVHA